MMERWQREAEDVELDCQLVHETEAAYLGDFGDVTCWVPKSLSSFNKRKSLMTVKEWFANKEGLI